MLILDTLAFTAMASVVTLIIMAWWLALKSNVFFDKQDKRYSQVTMGNPLNAAFDDGLFTEKGLRWRALIGKVQIALWLGFLVIALVESFFAG